MQEIYLLKIRTVTLIITIGLFTLLAFAQQPNTTQENVVRVNILVTDKSGQPVISLHQEDFLLFEDDKPQTVSRFTSKALAINYILFLDHTGSMRAGFQETIEIAKKIVESTKADDKIMIIRIINGEIQESN